MSSRTGIFATHLLTTQYGAKLFLNSHLNWHKKHTKEWIVHLVWWLTHTLLTRTLCSLAHFADSYFDPQNILLLNTFWSLEHFASWNTLLPSTFCFLEHSAPWNTLLPGTFCSFVKCSPQHTLLSGTQKAKCSRKQSVPWSKVCWGEKYSWEQSVLRNKMCWGVKCVRN